MEYLLFALVFVVLIIVSIYVYILSRDLDAFSTLVKQRFMEAGINLDQKITTNVTMPDQWVETEGMDEAQRVDAVSTGVLRSRHTEWTEL